jgi:hypothetical protein
VAQAGGDPYLYPLCGPPVKLPNTYGLYRLYQDGAVQINAEVSRASAAARGQIEHLLQAASSTAADGNLLLPGVAPVASEAYFFSRLCLSGPGGDDDVVLVDLEHGKCTTGSTPTFRVGQPYVDTRVYDYAAGNDRRPTVSLDICWGVGRACLTVSFSKHAQVRNGVCLRGISRASVTDGSADGLLLRNYRPKLFMIPCLQHRKPVTLRQSQTAPGSGCRRVLTQRGLAGHHEGTILVRGR